MARGDDRGDFGAVGLRQLQGGGADRAGRAIDQNLVSRSQAKSLEARVRIEGAFANDGGFEASACGDRSDGAVFGYADVFRVRAIPPRRTHAEHAIARLE